MSYDDYPEQGYADQGYADPGYGRRPPGYLTVIFTSLVTSAVVTCAVLYATGNLSLASLGLPATPAAPAATDSESENQFSQVPVLKGLPTKSAVELLRGRNLRMVVRAEAPDEKAQRGIIIKQEPLPDSELVKGGQVSVVVSSGPQKETVPDVVGKKMKEAAEILKEAGIEIGSVSETGTGEPGTVTSIKPSPGSEVEKGSEVDLVVTPSGVAVPKLLGLRTKKAKRALKKAGLKLGKIKWRYIEHRPANLVLSQDPDPGTKVEIGSAVDLVLNQE
jgi:beta-lactam-binding protein with PASTA domain